MSLLIKARRAILGAIGVPPGVGILFSRRARWQLVGALLGSLVIALLEMVAVATVLPLMQLLTGASSQTGLLGRISGVIGADTDRSLAIFLATVIFVGFTTKAVLAVVLRWWMLGTLMRQEIATSTRMLRYFLLAPYSLHLKRHTGEMLRNMNDAVSQVYGYVIAGSLSAIAEMLTIGGVSLTLLVVQPVPTVILIVYFGLAAFVYQRTFQPRAIAAGEQLLTSSVGIYLAGTQALGGIKDIKLRGTQTYFLSRYTAHRLEAAAAIRMRVFLGELPKYIMEILFIIGIGLMTIVVYLGSASAQALSLVALFAAAGFRVLPSVVRSMASITSVRSGGKAVGLLLDDVRDSLNFTERVEARTRIRLDSALELENIGFAYVPGTDVLRGIDLVVPRGTALALVGGSGAGKTTLVDVMAGFHKPSTGRILCDGVDIADRIGSWQAGVAIVPQAVYLTTGSLRENIAFGVEPEEVDEDRLGQVIEQAQLEEVIATLPDGLDASIGEAGDRLSGGQRQRIGVARALYADPTFLILDEATSALDNETERRVTDTVKGLAGVVTTVIVAHRLSTVKDCDQIAFLSDGHVVAAGTFDEVRAASPEFEHLVQLGNLIDH